MLHGPNFKKLVSFMSIAMLRTDPDAYETADDVNDLANAWAEGVITELMQAEDNKFGDDTEAIAADIVHRIKKSGKSGKRDRFNPGVN